MYDYLKFSHTNNFNNIYGCLENLNTCILGCCFPYCLFGYIYEKLEKGSCIIGCCKFYISQFIINSIFTIIIFSIEWENLNKMYNFKNNNNNNCNQIPICYNQTSEYNLTDLIHNKCKMNTTQLCNCIKNTIINECNFYTNLNSNNLTQYIMLLILIQIVSICCFYGFFLGYYRTETSRKYNILYNSRYNFIIHCNPLTNLCALCQEYNSIERIETIIPINPVSNKFIS